MGDEYFTIGINGKNSEFHAAMGLCVLPMMNSFIDNRKATSELYDFLLTGLPIQTPKAIAGTGYNYSYYPIIFDSEERLLLIKSLLQQNQINTRRYFYPSLNNLPQYKGEVCPVSESVSVRALALPMYYDLEKEIVSKICDLIKTCF
jgi:dTDP-4-amino-4,6-dideoxygalactose transaminase